MKIISSEYLTLFFRHLKNKIWTGFKTLSRECLWCCLMSIIMPTLSLVPSIRVKESYARKYDIQMNFSGVAALFFTVSVILTICILHVFGSPRAAWARIILQSTDTEFRYDFKSSQVFSFKKKKRKKEMYFKNLKKKKRKHLFGALQITSTHTHALHPFLPSFLSLAKNTHPTTRTVTQFCSWIRLLESVVTYSLQRSRYFIRTIYISIYHSLFLSYIHLSLSFSCSSFYQIYLPILLLCCTFFRQYSNAFYGFTLCTLFPGRPVAKESGMLARLKK